MYGSPLDSAYTNLLIRFKLLLLTDDFDDDDEEDDE